jgi:hypothetical protein
VLEATVRSLRSRSLPFVLAILLTGSLAALAMAETLSDGTKVEHWIMPNGLRVVTRHVPDAHINVVTLCYRLGTLEDPEKQEGLADLCGQVAITARAGDVPQRQLAEIDQVRPSGWGLRIATHITELTEAGPKDVFPGVLHQMCQRLRGLVVTDALVQRERAQVKERLKQNYDANVEGALTLLSAQVSSGKSPERAMRYVSGEGVESIKPKTVRDLLAERLVPTNSTLSIVGDLQGMDVKKLLERDLGDVPAGKAGPPIPWGHLMSARGIVNRGDLTEPVMVAGVLSPALSDSMHAYFLAYALSIGAQGNVQWGKPSAPLTRRFDFSFAIDPELMRYYPPIPIASISGSDPLDLLFQANSDKIADSTNLRAASEAAAWLAGGPLIEGVARRVATDPSVTFNLSQNLAALEQYGSPEFWADYRRRALGAGQIDPKQMFDYFANPRRQVTFVLKPGD